MCIRKTEPHDGLLALSADNRSIASPLRNRRQHGSRSNHFGDHTRIGRQKRAMSDDAFKALEANITTLLFDRPWPADREAIVRLELKLFALGLQEKVPGKPDQRRLGKSQKLDLLITFSGLC